MNVQQGSFEYQLLKSFGRTWPGIEPRSTNYEADTNHVPGKKERTSEEHREEKLRKSEESRLKRRCIQLYQMRCLGTYSGYLHCRQVGHLFQLPPK